MGNNCVGPRIPKDGLCQMMWESQVCNAVTCGSEERSIEWKMQSHVYEVPQEQMMTTQANMRPTTLQSSPEGIHAVLQRPQSFEEDNKPAEPGQQELKKVSNVVNSKHESSGKSKQVEYTIVTKPAEAVIRKKSHNAKDTLSIGLQMESVLEAHNGYFKEFYSLGKEIGYGRFGKTFLCVEKSSGEEYACKCIAKRRLTTMEDVNDVRKEIQIMHHLAGHPNIIQINGVYEDPVAVFVVMELCKGGELFHKIMKFGRYKEKKAAQIARIILGVVAYCSSVGVFHRDLKPENFLFINDLEDSPVKAIDFGLSEFFSPGESFTQVVGSPFYVAPEVLNMCYGPKADVWSAGVIIYILLSGEPPFWAETNEETFQKVLHGNLDFSADPWPKISESAKDLIKKLLVRDPTERLSAHEALGHPWLQVDVLAPEKPLDPAYLSHSTKFSAMSKLKEMALKVISEKLSKEEIVNLKEFFKACLDNRGTIDYRDFLAATYQLQTLERQDCLSAVFSSLDEDGSGYITEDDLQRAYTELGIKEVRVYNKVNEVYPDSDVDAWGTKSSWK